MEPETIRTVELDASLLEESRAIHEDRAAEPVKKKGSVIVEIGEELLVICRRNRNTRRSRNRPRTNFKAGFKPGSKGQRQGRYAKQVDAKILSCMVEAELVEKVKDYCEKEDNRLPSTTGGFKNLPRPDAVSGALELFLFDPDRAFARFLFDHEEFQMVEDLDKMIWISNGNGTRIPVGGRNEARDESIRALIEEWK